LVIAYLFEAVITRRGEADQSLLFWYLPFLFLGIIGLVAGLGTGILSIQKLRKEESNKNSLT